MALSLGDNMRAEELDREPELKLGPAANAIKRREQFAAEAEGRDYEPLTQRGARVHAVRQAKAVFAEMRERVELARDAWPRRAKRAMAMLAPGWRHCAPSQGGRQRKLTRTRSSSGLRALPGVILGQMTPAMKLGAMRSVTG